MQTHGTSFVKQSCKRREETAFRGLRAELGAPMQALPDVSNESDDGLSNAGLRHLEPQWLHRPARLKQLKLFGMQGPEGIMVFTPGTDELVPRAERLTTM